MEIIVKLAKSVLIFDGRMKGHWDKPRSTNNNLQLLT